MSRLRPICAMQTPGVDPMMADAPLPKFEMVDPSELLVDEAYQRNLSERSVGLIRRVVGAWDWRRFKPPVVARTSAGLEVIDGQHTAIAAASHPMVGRIPVMVVEAAERSDRAVAFIGHNRDRIAITPTQLHAAAVAAGDEDAVTIDQVCRRAGIRILKTPPGNGAFKPRETLAVSSIRALVNRRGALKARVALQVLADAELAPVSAGSIKAVEMLLNEVEYAGLDPKDLTTAIRALGSQADQDAKVFAAAHSVPIWRAIGIVYFRRARRGHRRAERALQAHRGDPRCDGRPGRGARSRHASGPRCGRGGRRMIRPTLTLLATLILLSATIYGIGLAGASLLLTLAQASTPYDDFAGACGLALFVLSLAALSRVQRWRG